jgi:hypothetical protein
MDRNASVVFRAELLFMFVPIIGSSSICFLRI